MSKRKKPELLRTADEECFKFYEHASAECATDMGRWHATWREDYQFALVPGFQWSASAKNSRLDETNVRPVLELNQTKTFIDQIINPVISNPPGVHVIPAYADPGDNTLSTANICEGMLRSIEINNGGQAAFLHAFKTALYGGFGAFYLRADWEKEKSFNKKLIIEKILDPTHVRWDSSSVSPDGSDMRYAMIDEAMSKEAFEAAYPDIPKDWYDQLNESGNEINSLTWGEREKPIITNFIYKHTVQETLYQLKERDEDGNPVCVWEDEDFNMKDVEEDKDGEPISRLASRTKTYWKKLGGGYLLDESEWPGTNIPVYIVPGKDIKVENERHLLSMTRYLKQAQEGINYAYSGIVERAGLAPQGHWMAAAEAVGPDYEQLYAESHLHKKLLIFNAYDSNAQETRQLPVPQYIAPPNIDPNLVSLLNYSVEAMKAISGLFNPSVGNAEQELSGVAIGKLQQQGTTANSDYLHHSVRVYRRLMNDILDLIPEYYSEERQMEITGKDGTQASVWINKPYKDKQSGKMITHDVTKRRYQCVVEIGKGYSTQIQENAEWINSQAQANPMIAQTLPDLLFKIGGEAAGADASLVREGVERIKRALPPQLLANTQLDQANLPPQVQSILGQNQQKMQEMQTVIHQALQKIQELEQEKKVRDRELGIKEFEAVTHRMDAVAKIGAKSQEIERKSENELQMEHIHNEHEMDKETMRTAVQLNGQANKELIKNSESQGSTGTSEPGSADE